MKKLLIVLLLVISFKSTSASPPNILKSDKLYSDTTVLPQILGLNLQSFIGRPVDSLLFALPSTYTDRGFKPMGVGFCRGITQGYGMAETNSCFVEIFIDTFQHMTFPDRRPTSSWDMNLAKQETIAYIKVWKNNRCIYNCTDPRYQ